MFSCFATFASISYARAQAIGHCCGNCKHLFARTVRAKKFASREKIRLVENGLNCEKAELEKSAVAKHSWTNDHRIKWNEASILATESHKFSRKMRESIEIEKHSTIDQEGKPLDSTWRALFTVQN